MKRQVTVTFDVMAVGRWLLAGLLLWAAVSKLANPTEFLGSIYAYELPLPRGFLRLVAIALPWIELLCGLFLLLGIWPESVLVTITGLLGIFVVATAQAWVRGLRISCGCFDLKMIGLKDHFPDVAAFIESPGFALLRNLGLAALAAYLLRQRLESAAASTPVPAAVPGSGRRG